MTNPPQPSLEPLPLEMRLRALEGRVGRAAANQAPLVSRVEALTAALEDAVAGVPALKQFYDNCELSSGAFVLERRKRVCALGRCTTSRDLQVGRDDAMPA